MNSYFEPCPVRDNIYHIYEPGGVYSSLIIGTQKALLIDTGYGYGDLGAAVREITGLPLIVVNTHGHFDHVGGNYLFDEVYINYEELPVYYWYMTEVRPITTDKFIKQTKDGTCAVIPEDFSLEAYMSRRNKKFLPLKNHQFFDLGGRTVEAVFLPGHTNGSVVFFDWQSNIAFSGDNISNNVWIQFDFSAALYDYAANLEAFSRQYPIEGILAAHSRILFPARLIDWIEYAIGNIDDSKSKTFIHPRTGSRALMHKEPVDDMDGVSKIHIIYNKNNKYSEAANG